MTLAVPQHAYEIFAQHYVAMGARRVHAAAALEAAGFKSENSNTALTLLNRPEVKVRVQEILAERHGELEITAKRTFEEMARIAFSDPADLFDANGHLLPIDRMSPAQRAVISSIEFETTFTGPSANPIPVITVKVKLWDKPSMLKVFAQHYKIISNDQAGLNALAGELASQLRAGRERAQAARRAPPAEIVEEARIIAPSPTPQPEQEFSDEEQIW